MRSNGKAVEEMNMSIRSLVVLGRRGLAPLLSLGLMAAAGINPSLAEDPVKLTFSVFEPAQGKNNTEVYSRWAKMVNDASEGALQIEVLAGGQLGTPQAQLELVTNRVADMAIIIPGFTPGRYEGNEIGELPFLWSDPTAASVALTRLVDRGLLPYGRDVEVLGITVPSPYTVHSAKPVPNLEALSGLRMRAGGPIMAAMVSALGATPVSLPPPQAAESISRGVLDASMNDWSLAAALKILEVAPHHFVYPLGGSVAILGMNKDVYAGLPEKAKAAIDQMRGVPFAVLQGELWKSENARLLAEISANPAHTVVIADAAASAEWEAALRPVVDEWVAKSKANEALLAAFKEELAKADSDIASGAIKAPVN